MVSSCLQFPWAQLVLAYLLVCSSRLDWSLLVWNLDNLCNPQRSIKEEGCPKYKSWSKIVAEWVVLWLWKCSLTFWYLVIIHFSVSSRIVQNCHKTLTQKCILIYFLLQIFYSCEELQEICNLIQIAAL